MATATSTEGGNEGGVAEEPVDELAEGLAAEDAVRPFGRGVNRVGDEGVVGVEIRIVGCRRK